MSPCLGRHRDEPPTTVLQQPEIPEHHGSDDSKSGSGHTGLPSATRVDFQSRHHVPIMTRVRVRRPAGIRLGRRILAGPGSHGGSLNREAVSFIAGGHHGPSCASPNPAVDQGPGPARARRTGHGPQHGHPRSSGPAAPRLTIRRQAWAQRADP